jgi:putative nucleotidyltransferase with HDIG domain
MPKVAAIILAGGFSSRMGAFKPLLPLAGRSALERSIRLFQTAGISDVRVVTGHRAAELGPLLKDLDVCEIANPNYAAGMFSSVAAGLASLAGNIDACLVLPVDLPLVRSATVRSLVQNFTATPAKVLYPCFGGKRGHPPLIAGDLARRIPAWCGPAGLQGALSLWENQAREIAVADELILYDMDRPDDFQQLQRRALRLELPNRRECQALWELNSPDEQIIRHCRAVAELAVELGGALNAAGLALDLELLETAALVHDLARCEKDHARIGAERLKSHDFPALTELVACHMDLPQPLRNTITDVEVLYLADKLVLGERRVSLRERFAKTGDRFRNDPQVREKIAARKGNAEIVRQQIEQLLGRPLTEVGVAP